MATNSMTSAAKQLTISMWVAVASVSVWSPAARAQDVQQPSPVIVPITVIAPDFPEGIEAAPPGIGVTVSGTVLPDGTMPDPLISAEPGQETFASAVRKVVPLWRFTPAVDRQACKPKATEGHVLVTFVGTWHEPHVYLSMAKAPVPSARPPPLEVVSAPKVDYPSRLLRNDIEGRVNVLMAVSTEGKVTSAEVLSSTPPGRFDELALDTAKATTYKWREAPESAKCFLRPYTFCINGLRDSPARFPGCRGQ